MDEMLKCLFLSFLLVLTGCESSSRSDSATINSLSDHDFSAADQVLEEFVAQNSEYDGVSYTVIDQTQGTLHEAAFGDHELDIIVLLASVSKVPATMLLMALHEDPNLDFDINEPIASYLPWLGVYGDATTAQLLSNTSGIIGLEYRDNYGDHNCQFEDLPDLMGCAETLYTTELPHSVDPGTRFSYGGSQWQLAGAVAEEVGGANWAQLFDQYIAQPCELEVFRFGNPWANGHAWNGSPDSLIGQSNPNIEAGAISNMRDYAKLLQMILDGGRCGNHQVLSQKSLTFMQTHKAQSLGAAYGLGWWIADSPDAQSPTLFYDTGAFGSIAWLDTARGYAGYLAVEGYSAQDISAPIGMTKTQIIPLVEQVLDRRQISAN